MRVHAIADRFFDEGFIDLTLAGARAAGFACSVGAWEHPSLAAYRTDVLLSETDGPDSVRHPPDYAAMAGLAEAEMLVVQFCPVTAQVLEHAPRLKYVGVNRVGVENVAVAALREAGVRVVNVVGRNAQAVAEFSVGMLLAELRDIARADERMRRGEWVVDYPGASARRELRGSTVGIVGAGPVGLAAARTLAGFDCRVLMHAPHDYAPPAHAAAVGFEELLRESDFVMLHARLVPGVNDRMLSEREFGMMKKGAVLVNTARAGLVDEAALVAALRSGQLGGAALDVFHEEPPAPGHGLQNLPNVTLTPHIAGVTREAWENAPRMMSEFIVKIAAGDLEQIPFLDEAS
ncbi:MAG: hypothetical protein ISN26_06740 [Betaproteobacteria bacterium AqS2]|uniref:3-phosphoglycerate dehydrogenase n=1 Tax=Candidatus Amphirhobacter heronislandensis TaxID=1732024 RepID=A0A930UFQ4_9GAMM|nr:hypothetical protein [Betaproteobacteria bacterium AqS2]